MHRGSETRGNENIGVMIVSTLASGDVDNFSAVAEEDIPAFAEQQDVDGRVHIRQDGLIWSSYFPSYAKEIEEGIESGKLFVSMECFFNEYGYAIRESEGGPITFLERTSATEALDDAFRIKGGKGTAKINGKMYQVGRWLKDITFSGQGMVYKPANTLGD